MRLCRMGTCRCRVDAYINQMRSGIEQIRARSGIEHICERSGQVQRGCGCRSVQQEERCPADGLLLRDIQMLRRSVLHHIHASALLRLAALALRRRRARPSLSAPVLPSPHILRCFPCSRLRRRGDAARAVTRPAR